MATTTTTIGAFALRQEFEAKLSNWRDHAFADVRARAPDCWPCVLSGVRSRLPTSAAAAASSNGSVDALGDEALAARGALADALADAGFAGYTHSPEGFALVAGVEDALTQAYVIAALSGSPAVADDCMLRVFEFGGRGVSRAAEYVAQDVARMEDAATLVQRWWRWRWRCAHAADIPAA
jgi:hypothetical protein